MPDEIPQQPPEMKSQNTAAEQTAPAAQPPAASPQTGSPVPVTVLPAAIYDSPQPLRVELVTGGWWGRYGARVAWIVAGLCVLALFAQRQQMQQFLQPNPHINEQHFDYGVGKVEDQLQAENKIAIITVSGTILHQEGFAKWQIDQVRSDPAVVAVVLRVDSPGGTVTGSNYIYHQLRKLTDERNLPLVVSMGGVCASGGYYISMAANPPNKEVIFAEPTTWTGSIGVMIPHYDVSELLTKWDIKDDTIVSHPLKNAGSFTKRFTDAERKIFQLLVDESFADFKEIVKRGRPRFISDEAALDKVATGQIFTAKQALAAGLVDEIGYLDDAVKQAAKLAQITDLATVRAVRYAKPRGLFDEAFGGLLGEAAAASATHRQLSPTELFSFATPRAYYLWSLGPTLFQSGN